jgi:uncharacterized membrane protein (UPF0127 family)
MREIVLVGRDGQIVCERCRLATTPLARLRGLLGRRELPPGHGILLRPASSIHTLFMRFAIDVAFLDANLRVLEVRAAIVPWRAAWHRGADAILELAAGECDRLRIRPNDHLAWAKTAT